MSGDDQAQAVRDLIRRNIGLRASEFNISVSAESSAGGKDTFKVGIVFSVLAFRY